MTLSSSLYWDANGFADGAGGAPTGQWGFDDFWNSDPAGGAVGFFFTDTTSNHDLYFVAGPSTASGNAAYTVTVLGEQVARSLNFQSSGIATLSGGISITLGDGSPGAGGITVPQYAFGTTAQGNPVLNTPVILNNAQTWTVHTGRTLTVGGAVSGSGRALTKSGSGILILSGANSYDGGTLVELGTLRFNSAGAIGGIGRDVNVANGATVTVGYAIDNAFLNRLVENTNTFNVNVAATSTNALDFSSSTGANLPNAVLTGSGNLIYGGILTPNGNTFRLGNSSTATSFANGNLFTVSNVLSGAGNSVVIAGGSSQPVYLTGANSYGGTTTVSPGAAVGFVTANVTGLGLSSILVGEDASVLRTGGNLNNAFLQLIAQTTNTFTIYANNAGSGNALDLSGTNGGRYLPNASLAFWDNAGTRTFNFTGTITPADDTYRFGGSRAANFINLPNPNTLTGARSLVVDGQSTVKLRIYNANNFSGETLVKAGTIFVITNRALENSTINASGGGVIDVSGDRQPSTPNWPVQNPIIGGLKGAKDIVSVFNSSYTTWVINLVLNPGEGVINSYSGVIADGQPGMALSKTGPGTQILSGTNTYTGTTTVSNGTLVVNGLIGPGTVTVAPGGTLGGSGTINSSVTLNGTLSPGASVGTLTTSNQTWHGGAALVFELSSATDRAGMDHLVINGLLDVVATPDNKFTIKLVSMADNTTPGPVPDFNPNASYAWVIAQAAHGMWDIDPNAFTIDTTAFANAHRGTFSVAEQDLISLVLTYTPAPAPLSFSSFGPWTGTSFPLTFHGPSSQGYRVLASTNVALPLSSWTVLTSGTFGDSPVNYTDTGATNTQKFYSIVSP